MGSNDEVTKQVEMFKALGDENRLAVVRAISEKDDVCACTLLEKLDISQSTLSHHMKILCHSGIVDCHKVGKWSHYVINKEALSMLSGVLEGLA